MIIPAAGLGTRVGSPPAKELLSHPKEDGSFLEVALKKASTHNLTPLVISRVDKIVLNDWLFKNQIPHILVTKTSEWVETVLLSKNYWREKNLLLLPDTEFSPEMIIQEMISELDSCSLIFATFEVDNISLWGSVKNEGNKNYISEKNKTPQKGRAWGLISFTKIAGDIFWPLYLKSQEKGDWVEMPVDFSEKSIGYFADLTRG